MTEPVHVSPAARQALEVLTVDQVCELLKVKKSWLYDQVEQNGFPAYRVGRQLRFRVEEVQEWLSGQRQRRTREERVQVPQQRKRSGPARKA